LTFRESNNFADKITERKASNFNSDKEDEESTVDKVQCKTIQD
jgi:hypothetical protein